ncbi:MAG TPA: hypothetical protein VEJ41_08820 [Candidatus Acidoferrales bacterium]|nr:hypothetical protein [Candidatus Acidoferrales bacterium]
MNRKLGIPAIVLAIAATAILIAQSATYGDASAREGCKNQWLFNGVWRVRVTDVEPYLSGNQQVGWQVTEVWGNGTARELAPTDVFYKTQTLELSTGSIGTTDSTTGSMSEQQVAFNELPPAGKFTHVQIFLPPTGSTLDPANKPKGLLITFDGGKLAQAKSKPQFTSSKYDFQFNLGCVATGAAANAEGGANEIAATPGCMNQWMSNGIWKMRVTGFGPPPGVSAQDQNGWLVTQTWVNMTNRSVWPGVLANGPSQPPTNVSDEYIVTQSGNSVSSASAAGGFHLGAQNKVFPPGGSYTFSQPFGGSGLNATDKPVRLLITFDAATQNSLSGSLAGAPHYHLPANFRIDLTCSK